MSRDSENINDNPQNLLRLSSVSELETLCLSPGYVNAVKQLIESIHHPLRIALTSQKTILLEFCKPNGDYISFEIASDNRIIANKSTYHETFLDKQIEYNDVPMEVDLFYCL